MLSPARRWVATRPSISTARRPADAMSLRVRLCEGSMTTDRLNTECDEDGVTTMPPIEGSMIGPPAEKL
jgi:hypothetical protein